MRRRRSPTRYRRRRIDLDVFLVALIPVILAAGLVAIVCVTLFGPRGGAAASREPVSFCVNPDSGPQTDRPLIDLLAEAVSKWQDAAGVPLPLSIGGLCTESSTKHGDGVSVVGWGSLKENTIGTAFRRPSHGAVREADIVLSESWSSASDSDCLLSVLLHEVGHVLGLDHQDDESSIMHRTVPCGAVLSDADIAAIRSRFPAN